MYLPYQFVPKGVFSSSEMHELYYLIADMTKEMNKNNQELSQSGQLSSMYCDSPLEKFLNLHNKKSNIVERLKNYFEYISFISKNPLLVISDQSLPHRKSIQANSETREVITFLPYERLSMNDFIRKAEIDINQYDVLKKLLN